MWCKRRDHCSAPDSYHHRWKQFPICRLRQQAQVFKFSCKHAELRQGGKAAMPDPGTVVQPADVSISAGGHRPLVDRSRQCDLRLVTLDQFIGSAVQARTVPAGSGVPAPQSSWACCRGTPAAGSGAV
ncbi:hypothetical protein WJX73_005897 [Symbiochloris irregularis]|uniref:Uncharacterized protein n=1 Tax=Symbiochloris irregularis TaxID=706552 RepID=A0AAW1NET7_9CHLO